MLSKEQKTQIISILNKYVSLQSQFYEYNWLENYHGQDYYNRLVERLKALNIDFNGLSRSDALLLGMQKSNIKTEDDINKEIWFIPLHLYRVIPNGTHLTDSLGGEFIFNSSNMPDNDNRYGFLAYGITIKDETRPDDGGFPCRGCVSEGSEECANNPCDKVKKQFGWK